MLPPHDFDMTDNRDDLVTLEKFFERRKHKQIF